VQVDDLVEEKCPSRGPCEPGGDELAAVGEEGVALRAGKEAAAANVLQVDPTHCAKASSAAASSKASGRGRNHIMALAKQRSLVVLRVS
jgi:hypothetical protein